MLFLLFTAGDNHYAIETRRVQEVIPLVTLRTCPAAPDYISGLFNYRGHVTPVADLSMLLTNAPCPVRLNTRIIVVSYTLSDGRSRLLGLMAEQVTQTMERNDTDFSQLALADEANPFLGHICSDGGEMIQCIHPERLLPKELESLLFEKPGDNLAPFHEEAT